ncbi:MAG: hypothetical protein LBN09_04490 [Clostridioides sp.]|jgi:Na+/melibiose symporter-like transporter|nr:hypothetical protein [Clostridioides sp.]
MVNQYLFYNLHLVITKFGDKITSLVLVFYFAYFFPKDSLILSIVLFSISSIPSIVFANVYKKVIENLTSYKVLVMLDLVGVLTILCIYLSLDNIYRLFTFYVLHIIVQNITERIDSSLFFSITKSRGNEKSLIRYTNTIQSFM